MSAGNARESGVAHKLVKAWVVFGLTVFVLALLTACTSAPVVTQVRTVEVPVEVTKPIPEELTAPLPYPVLDNEITVEGLVEAFYGALDTVDQCNADRASVRAISPNGAD